MPGRKWNPESIWRSVRQPIDAIRPEIMILALLAIGDNRGTCRLKPFDRVPNRFVVEGIQTRIREVSRFLDRHNQFRRAWNAPDRFGWDSHLSVISAYLVRAVYMYHAQCARRLRHVTEPSCLA